MRKGLLWAMAVAALLGLASPSVLAEPDRRVPPGFDPDTRYVRGAMPFKVMMAEQALVKERNPENARLRLIAFFVDATDRGVEKARDLGLQQGWNAHMLGFYEKVRAEIRPLTAEPRKVYDFAWALARQAGYGEVAPYLWKDSDDLKARTAWNLHVWSSMNGVKEADFEVGQGFLASEEHSKTGRFTIWHLAKNGYPPAILDIVSRYETGNGFEKDKKKAFYWATKGVVAGLPLSEQASRLRESLSVAEINDVESWIIPPYWR